MAMASVTSKLSRVARLATTPRLLAPPQFCHGLAGDSTSTIRVNGAGASPLGSRFLADLPAGECEDSTGCSPVDTEPDEDLGDEYDHFFPDPATIFHYDDKDLASDESMWALYERWCSFFKVARGHDEMRRRFDHFKWKARDIYEFNKSGRSYTKALNDPSDRLPHEFFRRAPRSPSDGMGTHVFYDEKGEITAFLTNGILKEINAPAPIMLRRIKPR